jgi:hypothetical protein
MIEKRHLTSLARAMFSVPREDEGLIHSACCVKRPTSRCLRAENETRSSGEFLVGVKSRESRRVLVSGFLPITS